MKCASFVSLCCLFVLSTTIELPDFVQLCPRNSPDISLCFKKTMESLRPRLVKGVPELRIPSISPLIIPKIAVAQDKSSNLNYDSVLKNVKISGLENFEILSLAIDLNKPTLSLKLRLPKVDLSSGLTTKGKLLVIAFEGDGTMEGSLGNGILSGEWSGNKITKNGKEHVAFQLTNHTIEVETLSAIIKDLFKNNPELNDNFNRVIEENIDLLKPDVAPVLGKVLIDVIGQFINGVFDLYSLDQLFPQK